MKNFRKLPLILGVQAAILTFSPSIFAQDEEVVENLPVCFPMLVNLSFSSMYAT